MMEVWKGDSQGRQSETGVLEIQDSSRIGVTYAELLAGKNWNCK